MKGRFYIALILFTLAALLLGSLLVPKAYVQLSRRNILADVLMPVDDMVNESNQNLRTGFIFLNNFIYTNLNDLSEWNRFLEYTQNTEILFNEIENRLNNPEKSYPFIPYLTDNFRQTKANFLELRKLAEVFYSNNEPAYSHFMRTGDLIESFAALNDQYLREYLSREGAYSSEIHQKNIQQIEYIVLLQKEMHRMTLDIKSVIKNPNISILDDLFQSNSKAHQYLQSISAGTAAQPDRQRAAEMFNLLSDIENALGESAQALHQQMDTHSALQRMLEMLIDSTQNMKQATSDILLSETHTLNYQTEVMTKWLAFGLTCLLVIGIASIIVAGKGAFRGNEEEIHRLEDKFLKLKEMGRNLDKLDILAFRTNIAAIRTAMEAEQRGGPEGRALSLMAEEALNLAKQTSAAARQERSSRASFTSQDSLEAEANQLLEALENIKTSRKALAKTDKPTAADIKLY